MSAAKEQEKENLRFAVFSISFYAFVLPRRKVRTAKLVYDSDSVHIIQNIYFHYSISRHKGEINKIEKYCVQRRRRCWYPVRESFFFFLLYFTSSLLCLFLANIPPFSAAELTYIYFISTDVHILKSII